MKAEEVRNILTLLRINYPASYKNITATESKNIMMVWCDALKDVYCDNYLDVIKEYVYSDESSFAPAVGKIVNMLKNNQLEIGDSRIETIKKYIDDGDYRNDHVLCYMLCKYDGSEEWKKDFQLVFGESFEDYERKIHNEFELYYGR